MTDTRLQVDPITLEVIAEGLSATMAEMRANVMHAAYSSVIALSQDFSCGLFSPEGDMIAQGPDHPGHIVPLPWGVRSCMEDLGDTLAPGDIVVLNDPYRGGTHLNDVTVLMPMFREGRLFCFPAVRAHWADVGGISPGSYSGEATNIFYEGVRIPPIKLYDQGRLNEAAFRLLMNNVRLPEERQGDLLACIGACRVGARRIEETVQRYGEELFLAAIRTSLDVAEERMRRCITRLPDGEYFAEDYIEFFSDGRLDPALVALRLEVAGDKVTADFTRSSAQLPGVVNSTAAVTLAGVIIALKSTLDPSGRINAGTFRPITCLTEPGSVVDVAYDAPANAHGEVRKRVVGVTLAALAQASPELVSGDLCGTSFPNVIGGTDPIRHRRFIFMAAPAGGNGAFLEADGPNALGNVDMGNLPLNYPAEEQESVFPLVFEEIALRVDSEGAGRTRGGLGATVRLRLLAETAQYSLTCDRSIIPPWGVFTAGSGAPIANVLRTADGKVKAFHTGKVSSYPLQSGDVVEFNAAGGGGYGDPLERDMALVADDVLDGYVSASRAREAYGVVFSSEGTVDDEATEKLREHLRSQRHWGMVVVTETQSYDGIQARHRVQRLSPVWQSLVDIEEGDLIELATSGGAPLRAWVRLDPALEESEIPLDPLGFRLLRIQAGDRVWVRKPRTINSANDLTVRTDRVLDLTMERR